MSYRSIDEIQKHLANLFFTRTSDSKKASGRALGTFVEIITYYMIKCSGFHNNLSIETKLPEYGNRHLTHNVEFTLHSIISEKKQTQFDVERNKTIKKIVRENNLKFETINSTGNLIEKCNGFTVIKNGLRLGTNKNSFVLAYVDSEYNSYRCTELSDKPYAMFECKRVGKEGDSKGPQTIEKAKQGAYVAKAISSLQKVMTRDGLLKGIYFNSDGNAIVDDYYSLVNKSVNYKDGIEDFIMTIGVVSNHGNWFTEQNKNKELEVLCNSYDWLLFLSDDGLAKFVEDIFSMPQCANALRFSYSMNNTGTGKNKNIFTKSSISLDADKELTRYFSYNIEKIYDWFTVINQNAVYVRNMFEQIAKLDKNR